MSFVRKQRVTHGHHGRVSCLVCRRWRHRASRRGDSSRRNWILFAGSLRAWYCGRKPACFLPTRPYHLLAPGNARAGSISPSIGFATCFSSHQWSCHYPVFPHQAICPQREFLLVAIHPITAPARRRRPLGYSPMVWKRGLALDTGNFVGVRGKGTREHVAAGVWGSDKNVDSSCWWTPRAFVVVLVGKARPSGWRHLLKEKGHFTNGQQQFSARDPFREPRWRIATFSRKVRVRPWRSKGFLFRNNAKMRVLHVQPSSRALTWWIIILPQKWLGFGATPNVAFPMMKWFAKVARSGTIMGPRVMKNVSGLPDAGSQLESAYRVLYSDHGLWI